MTFDDKIPEPRAPSYPRQIRAPCCKTSVGTSLPGRRKIEMLFELKANNAPQEFPPEALNSKIIFFHLDRVVVQVEAELNPLVEGNLWLSALKKGVTLNSLLLFCPVL